MRLIDLDSLTIPASPARPDLYAQALGLSGRAFGSDRRIAILKTLRADPSSQHIVMAGPARRAFWSFAPPQTTVLIDGVELTIKERTTSVVAWLLYQAGMTRSEAQKVAKTPPKSKRASTYEAYQKAGELAHLWDDQALDDLQGLRAIGGNDGGGAEALSSPAPPNVLSVADYERRAGDDLPFRYKVADNPLTIAEMSRSIKAAKDEGRAVGIDTEGTDESPHRAALVGFSVSIDDEKNYYCPILTPEGPAKYADLALSVLQQHVARLRWVGHNGAGYDYTLLKRHGIDMERAELVGDGMLAAYVYAQLPAEKGAKGLKSLVARFFDYQMTTFEQMLAIASEATRRDVTRADGVPIEIIAPYCCEDAYFAVKIDQMIRSLIVESGAKIEVYEKCELPLSIVLAEMELAGLPINLEKARKWRDAWRKIVRASRRELNRRATEAGWGKSETMACYQHGRKRDEIKNCSICDASGHLSFARHFNPNADRQIAEMLQGVLALPAMGWTEKTGEPRNNETNLLLLRQMCEKSGKRGKAEAAEWIGNLLEFNRESKVLSTYLEPFVRYAEPVTEHNAQINAPVHAGQFVIRCSFNQTGTVSSRLSTSDPFNAQNIPPEPRVLFEAPAGSLIWGADYSQIELRIIAKVTNCEALVTAFREGRDPHSLTAWRVFGVPEEKAKNDPNIRKRAKTLNFCVGYGGGPDVVQQLMTRAALMEPELNLVVPTLSECRDMEKEYWRAYPEILEWKVGYVDLMRRRGYAETLYGHRRYLPDLSNPNQGMRGYAERAGLNLVIQGTAGQIIKLAMLLIAEDMGKYRADLRNQVHDELWGLIEAGDQTRMEEWLGVVREDMQLDQPLTPVPIVVEPKLISNWKELK